jgi:hypothetical protein
MHNFGILAAQAPYFIYRSAELGNDGLREVSTYLNQKGMPFPKTIIYMNAEGYSFPLYFAIQEYNAQAKYGFQFFHSFGTPRTYLDGQDPYNPTDIIDRRRYLGPIGRRYFKYGDGKVTGGIDNLVLILNKILDPNNQPVLFHCLGGLHRTGMVAMLIRTIQGMPWKDIVDEYHEYNRLFPRENNIEFVEKFQSDPRFIEIRDKYAPVLQIEKRGP